MFLKFGSGLFLLFFALFAPAAPVIAQFGSMFFLLLIICLSPFLPAPSNTAAEAAPDSEQAYYWQITDDTAADMIELQAPRRLAFQLHRSPAAWIAPERYSLELHYSFPKNLNKIPEKPEKWRICCQPMRAGPLSV